jgi:hypothetical protein
VSQQQFSYFDPEHETVYEPRYINSDPREVQEYQETQEETVYYVTPEQSMLRGEKLIPTQRMTSRANWFITALFLLMLLFGGFLWAHEVLPSYAGGPGFFHSQPAPHFWNGKGHWHKPPHSWDNNEFQPEENGDNLQPHKEGDLP